MQVRNDFVNSIGGSCMYVVGIRDEDQLELECIPWLAEINCLAVTSNNFQLDPSCVGQLETK
jgi:hypothetical protein